MGETNPASQSKGKLENNTALLVGGTGGVGLAVAHELIRSSASVILTSSRKTKLDAVLDELRKCYPDAAANNKINGRVCDLGVPHIEQNVIELFNSIGKLDHIIYLAGDRLPTMPLGDFTLEAFAKQSQVRAAGLLLVAKHGIKCLGTSSSSSITITSGSIAGKPIAGGWSLLAFIGAGLIGLTRQLAFDLAPVRVNCVAL